MIKNEEWGVLLLEQEQSDGAWFLKKFVEAFAYKINIHAIKQKKQYSLDFKVTRMKNGC